MVTNTWHVGDAKNLAKPSDKKSKQEKPSRKNASKTKTTHEIMQEKFGSLSAHINTDSAKKRAIIRSYPSFNHEPEPQPESAVNIDHISLQLTDLPSYTLDPKISEKPNKHPSSQDAEVTTADQITDDIVKNDLSTVAGTTGVGMPEIYPPSVPEGKVERAYSNHSADVKNSQGEKSGIASNKHPKMPFGKLNTNPRHIDHRKRSPASSTQHSQQSSKNADTGLGSIPTQYKPGHSDHLNTNPRHVDHHKQRPHSPEQLSQSSKKGYVQDSGLQNFPNQTHPDSRSISNTIDLTEGIHVPHTPLDQWSTFANEPYYYNQPSYIPYEYVMFNPQTNTLLDHMFANGFPESVGGFVIHEPATPLQMHPENEQSSYKKHRTNSPQSHSTRISHQSEKDAAKPQTTPSKKNKRVGSLDRKSKTAVTQTQDGMDVLQNERVAQLKSLALSPISNQTVTEPDTEDKPSEDQNSVLSELYRKSPSNSYMSHTPNTISESQNGTYRYK